MADLSVDIDRPVDYDFRCFFLDRPRLELYERIEQRCEDMVIKLFLLSTAYGFIQIRDGLLKEAQYLLDLGLLPNQNCAARSIGYKQSMELLLVRISLFDNWPHLWICSTRD